MKTQISVGNDDAEFLDHDDVMLLLRRDGWDWKRKFQFSMMTQNFLTKRWRSALIDGMTARIAVEPKTAEGH